MLGEPTINLFCAAYQISLTGRIWVDSNSKLGCMCALGVQLRGRPWPIASYTQIKNVKMVGDAIHQTPYDVGGKKQDTSALNALLAPRYAARIGILSKDR